MKQIDSMFLGNSINQQPYLAILYKTILSTGYYGLFRIDEVTTGTYPVKARDVHIGVNKQKMLFILRTSKTHWSDSLPQSIKITSTNIDSFRRNCEKNKPKQNQYCPYFLLQSYLKVRVKYLTDTESFFMYRYRTPVKAHSMCRVLKRALQKYGMELQNYSLHSLRAGRVVDLLKLGVLVEIIQKLGRWKSNTIFTYLKSL